MEDEGWGGVEAGGQGSPLELLSRRVIHIFSIRGSFFQLEVRGLPKIFTILLGVPP